MPRRRPPDRLEQLVSAATEVFIRSGGYVRTQIGDVARAMGVAKGTVYLYVESKDALFDLVLRCADGRADLPGEDDLPLPSPPPGATLERLAGRIREGSRFPALDAAFARKRVTKPRAELEAILVEIYDRLDANKATIKLVGTSAHDLPELAEHWYGARGRLYTRLAEYIGDRARRGGFRAVPDAAVAARLVTETLTHFAVHRHWDPAPEPMDGGAARATAVAILTDGLAKERA